MAAQPPHRTTKQPAERRGGARYFYPAEVVRILGLEGIDYAQLRRLLRLVRDKDSQPSGQRWSRFGFEDLVAIRVAVRLAGGTEALQRGARLQFCELERACASLRTLGVPKPLTQVRLRRDGTAIVAEVDGSTFRPATGQLTLDVTEKAVRTYLAKVVSLSINERREFRDEVASVRASLSTAAARPRRPRGTAGTLAW